MNSMTTVKILWVYSGMHLGTGSEVRNPIPTGGPCPTRESS